DDAVALLRVGLRLGPDDVPVAGGDLVGRCEPRDLLERLVPLDRTAVGEQVGGELLAAVGDAVLRPPVRVARRVEPAQVGVERRAGGGVALAREDDPDGAGGVLRVRAGRVLDAAAAGREAAFETAGVAGPAPAGAGAAGEADTGEADLGGAGLRPPHPGVGQ